MELQKTLNSQSNVEKVNQSWSQSYNHQDSMVQKKQNRTIEQNRELRNGPTNI